MKNLIFLLLFLTLTLAGEILAGEIKMIELNDGSTIYGQILSAGESTYTIKTMSLGNVDVQESQISSIKSLEVDEQEYHALQQSMMKNDEIMDIIFSLQDDPDVQNVLNDPELMNALKNGNFGVLASSPKFMKLLHNPKFMVIRDKVTE